MSNDTYLECMGCGASYPPDYLTEEDDCPECGSDDLVIVRV